MEPDNDPQKEEQKMLSVQSWRSDLEPSTIDDAIMITGGFGILTFRSYALSNPYLLVFHRFLAFSFCRVLLVRARGCNDACVWAARVWLEPGVLRVAASDRLQIRRNRVAPMYSRRNLRGLLVPRKRAN